MSFTAKKYKGCVYSGCAVLLEDSVSKKMIRRFP